MSSGHRQMPENGVSIMFKSKKRRLIMVAIATAVITLASIAASQVNRLPQVEKVPTTKEPAGPNPSRINESLQRPVPQVVAPNRDPRTSVLEFVAFAGMSGTGQREEIRKALGAARENREVANVLCDEAFKAQKEDHSRALLILSLLGELRNPLGAQCLNRFLNLPFPQTGARVDGEIVEQTALGELQAKAIDGLAYFNTKATDEFVFRAVRAHPSIIVRAEAIEAYLWNHRDQGAEARRTLSQYVRKGEEIYLDRVRRETGENAESFNRKLDVYLKAHPEAAPPKPERETKPQTEKQRDTNPRYTKPPVW
jgi:hypothetical protein